uniref:Uncharacterized protein n=1 Tax=Moorena producens (strain JHB) TaxID=1454205 RepID=A0A1D9FZ86_MOOP1
MSKLKQWFSVFLTLCLSFTLSLSLILVPPAYAENALNLDSDIQLLTENTETLPPRTGQHIFPNINYLALNPCVQETVTILLYPSGYPYLLRPRQPIFFNSRSNDLVVNNSYSCSVTLVLRE